MAAVLPTRRPAKGIAEENESEMTAAITKEYERRRKNRKERDEYRGRSKAEKEEKGRASRSPHDEGFRNSEYYRGRVLVRKRDNKK